MASESLEAIGKRRKGLFFNVILAKQIWNF
jgi:hypothetical protein